MRSEYLDNPLPMNGVDRFMVALDKLARQGSSTNTCHLLLEFDGTVLLGDVELHLRSSRTVQSIGRMRACTFPSPMWRPIGEGGLEIQRPTTLQAALSIGIDPRRESPVRFTILTGSGADGATGCQILFTWHHALTDAHGAEYLVLSIFRGDSLGSGPPVSKFSLVKDLRAARTFVRHLFKLNATPPLQVHRPSRLPSGRADFQRISLPAPQFATLCSESGANLFPSLVTLAASCLTVWDLVKERGSEPGPLYVPVPHDTRRRGKDVRGIGNHVTFIFFGLPYRSNWSLRELTAELIDQMHSTFQEGLHELGATFFKAWRHMPTKPYSKLVIQPGHGRIASFFFSDLGQSKISRQAVGQFPLIRAQHFPPNIAPPGLTFVGNTTTAEREITVVMDDGLFDSSERSFIVNRISSILRGAVDE